MAAAKTSAERVFELRNEEKREERGEKDRVEAKEQKKRDDGVKKQ